MSQKFSHLGVPEKLVSALDRRGITTAFPVQEATIPDVLAGRDVCGKAPTGSGKTLAFGVPALARLGKATRNHPRGLVLAPTRELAEQIKQELAPLAQAVGRSVFAIYGGVGYGPQLNALRRGVDLLVATPGRLEDLIESGSVTLSQTDIVIIDEADRMADMGFLPAVRRILDLTQPRRQTLLFSATLDGDIATLSKKYQTDPVRHEAGSVETEAADVDHHFWLVDHHDRIDHAAEILSASGRSIVFTRTRHGADRLAKQLARHGLGAVAIHGGRSQKQRSSALNAFGNGTAQALVATDVAARGIHVEGVTSVIHFDPPADAKDYTHRSGRTARAGATGTVITLVTPQQKRAVRRLQQDLELQVPIEAPRMDILKAISPAPVRPTPPAPKGRPDREALPTSRDEAPARRRQERPAPDRDERRSIPARKKGPSIYVGNLPWDATDADVENLFTRYGHVMASTVIVDRRSGKSKGFGFVDMPQQAAQAAITALHGSEYAGRDLTVRFAQPSKWVR